MGLKNAHAWQDQFGILKNNLNTLTQDTFFPIVLRRNWEHKKMLKRQKKSSSKIYVCAWVCVGIAFFCIENNFPPHKYIVHISRCAHSRSWLYYDKFALKWNPSAWKVMTIYGIVGVVVASTRISYRSIDLWHFALSLCTTMHVRTFEWVRE